MSKPPFKQFHVDPRSVALDKRQSRYLGIWPRKGAFPKGLTITDIANLALVVGADFGYNAALAVVEYRIDGPELLVINWGDREEMRGRVPRTVMEGSVASDEDLDSCSRRRIFIEFLESDRYLDPDNFRSLLAAQLKAAIWRRDHEKPEKGHG